MVFPIISSRSRGFEANQDASALSFDRADSQYQTMTPPTGNRRTWFFRFVGKLSVLNVLQDILSTSGNSDSTFFDVRLLVDHRLQLGNWTTQLLVTSAAFSDPMANYDIGVAYDTTQASAPDRLGIIINGAWVSSFDTDNRASLSPNFEGAINSAIQHAIGRQNQSGGNLLSAICSFHEMVSGYIPAVSEVGKFDGEGRWQPKPYSGDHGVSGWLVQHTDNSTIAELGKDTRPLTSGQTANDWTPANFATTDQVSDTWSNNFCTWSGLSGTVRDGARAYDTGAGIAHEFGSQPVNGEFKFEISIEVSSNYSRLMVGLSSEPGVDVLTSASEYFGFYASASGNQLVPGPIAYLAASANDTFMFAGNKALGYIWIGKNGTWYNSGDPEAGTNPTWTGWSGDLLFPYAGVNSSNTATWRLRSLPEDLLHTTGLEKKTLCTANLPKPASGASVAPLTGSFPGTASASRNFVYLGYTPDQGGVCTINGNAITWGVHAIATANGFYTITASPNYNSIGSNAYSIAVKYAFGGKGVAPAPAQIN
ncbi:MAG: hypothetical protein VX620_15565 [Pseudomonadota bacterium]|nr:hypothetical protein [Pseudomonadota bacterium]